MTFPVLWEERVRFTFELRLLPTCFERIGKFLNTTPCQNYFLLILRPVQPANVTPSALASNARLYCINRFFEAGFYIKWLLFISLPIYRRIVWWYDILTFNIRIRDNIQDCSRPFRNPILFPNRMRTYHPRHQDASCLNLQMLPRATFPFGRALAAALAFSAPAVATLPASCIDLYSQGSTEDGTYTIYPDPSSPGVSVYCDQTTDGGGWMLTYAYNHVGGTNPAWCQAPSRPTHLWASRTWT